MADGALEHDFSPSRASQLNTIEVATGVPGPGDFDLSLDGARDALYEAAKRILDILGASLLLVSSLPVACIAAVLIKLTGRGPVLFVQQRLTKDGATFRMLKFRTMRCDAEETHGAQFAVKSDNRITRVGRFLRKHRIDELPQLVNVLRGEMSLVGPRPERPEIARRIAEEIPWFNRRLQVKAGLTGLAQVSCGYAESADEHLAKLAADIEYIQRRSILLDLRIVCRTVGVVLSGRGAR